MNRRLVLLLWAAGPDRPHLCATPFFNAAAAAAMDAEVEIYFTGKSVQLLARGVAASLPAGPRQRTTVYEFMQHAAEHGAKFYACSQALQEYAVEESSFIPETTGVAGAATYMERCLQDGTTVMVY